MKTAAQRLYSEIRTGNYGRDVNFIADVILTSASKPTTKLRNLLDKLSRGHDVRRGNGIDRIRVNGNQCSLSSLDLQD